MKAIRRDWSGVCGRHSPCEVPKGGWRAGDASARTGRASADAASSNARQYDGTRAASSALTAEAEAIFREQVGAAIPEQVRYHRRTRLMQDERAVYVHDAETLCGRGGVAPVERAEVPLVLRTVGTTVQPTAILTTQPAAELHLPRYRSDSVTCLVGSRRQRRRVISHWTNDLLYG